MKIAIISDIHENFHNLVYVQKEIEDHKVDQIIFLGDFINNGIAKFFAGSPVPVFAIWGNNDGDKVAITKTSLGKESNLTMSNNTYDFLEFDGRKIFISHFPDLADSMAKSGDFDAVFYGHNHLKDKRMVGDCVVANPGEISAHKTGTATYAIYDIESNDIDFFEVKNSISLKTNEVKDCYEKYRIRLN